MTTFAVKIKDKIVNDPFGVWIVLACALTLMGTVIQPTI